MNFAVFEAIQEILKSDYHLSRLTHHLLELHIDKKKLVNIITQLKTNYSFDLLLDITAVDYLQKRDERFQIVYHLYSTTHLVRIRLKTFISEENPSIESLTSLYGSAHFMERECHEMYGINFEGNKDLRPILLYNGFLGHPLRKDYPIDKEQPLVPYIK